MSKKNDSIIPLHPERKPAKKEQIISIGLIICDWKNEFTEHQCKVMIAEALNHCVYNDELKIAGYLITQRRVCLVLEAAPDQVNHLLQAFYKQLRKEIHQHTHRIRNLETDLHKEEETSGAEKHTTLFIRSPLQNYMLIRLITGRPVTLPYYSPHLERLKEKVNHYNFCSAIDYSGAKGPVVVKVLKPVEFE